MKIFNITILVLAFSMFSVKSGSQTYVMTGEKNEVLIKGTSNLHDWQMIVSKSNCEANILMENGQLKGIGEVIFRCNPFDIKSEHDLMDKKTYNALKADQFPEIRFSYLSAIELANGSGVYRTILSGKLYLSGITRNVNVPVDVTVNPDNSVHVTGSIDLRMSDFDIAPPTALLGTLKTGDKVSIHYSFNLSEKGQLSYRHIN